MTKGYIMARTNHPEAIQLKHISMMISMLHVMQSSANSCRKQSWITLQKNDSLRLYFCQLSFDENLFLSEQMLVSCTTHLW